MKLWEILTLIIMAIVGFPILIIFAIVFLIWVAIETLRSIT